jgi:hypothetical protein
MIVWRRCRRVAQCQTHPRRGCLIRGIAAEKRFNYEIMRIDYPWLKRQLEEKLTSLAAPDSRSLRTSLAEERKKAHFIMRRWRWDNPE